MSFIHKLPPEIRIQILGHLFRSTTLCFPQRSSLQSTPHALAITLTCRTLYTECQNLALPLVTFYFLNPEGLLDKLSTLPPALLARVKHVRTTARSLGLRPFNRQHGTLLLGDALELLPGLSLETLVVDDIADPGTSEPSLILRPCVTALNLIHRRLVSSGPDSRPKWAELHALLPLEGVVEVMSRLPDKTFNMSPSATSRIHGREVLSNTELRLIRDSMRPLFESETSQLLWALDRHGSTQAACSMDIYDCGEVDLGMASRAEPVFDSEATAHLFARMAPLSSRVADAPDDLAATPNSNRRRQQYVDRVAPFTGFTWEQVKRKLRGRHNADDDYAQQRYLELLDADPLANMLGG